MPPTQIFASSRLKQKLNPARIKPKNNTATFVAINHACIEQRREVCVNRFHVTLNPARRFAYG